MFSFFTNNRLPIDNARKQDILTPLRQNRLTKSLIFVGGLYLNLEAGDLINATGRLAIALVASCIIGNLLYGDGEYDPEQQSTLRY